MATRCAVLLGTLALLPASASAQSDLERGLSGALRGCEEWVLNPASWADGPAPFQSTVGLGSMMGLVKDIEDAAKPPASLRQSNRYWRINATTSAGYILVVSDRLPMCHITGGGDADLQPVVEKLLASADFLARWERTESRDMGEMTSTNYRSRDEPKFSIVISRAKQPGGRRDRVQLIATANYSMAN